MKYLGSAVTGLTLASLMFSGSASAFGIGGAVGATGERWRYESGVREDRYTGGLFFLFDTRLGGVSSLHYRLKMGTASSKPDGEGLRMTGTASSHVFGYHLVRQEGYSLWLGPRLNLVSYQQLHDGSSNEYEGSVMGIGLGPAGGIDLNFSKLTTLAVSAGVGAQRYYLDYRVTTADGNYRDTSRTKVNATSLYLNMSLIFHLGKRKSP